MTGVAGLVADRLRRELGVGRDLAGLAAVVDVHPLLRPATYVERQVRLADDHVELRLDPCPARDERGVESWIGLLSDGHDTALAAIAEAVDPGARIEALPADGEVLRWRFTLGHEPVEERPEVVLTRFSTGADFQLR
jgi:hypothetical protein